MKYHTLKNTDKMPLIGLGTWNAPKGEVHDAILSAIQLGYRHFDCAHAYDNEDEIGEAFAHAFGTNLVKREEVWITSKLWNNAHRPEEVLPALQNTLTNLQLDYLDLYLVHWPIAFNHVGFPTQTSHYLTPLQAPLYETWASMIAVRNSGFTRHIGVSNFTESKILDLIDKTGECPEVNQVELHPYLTQKNLQDFAKSHAMLLTAYKPLGLGVVTKATEKAIERKGLSPLTQHLVISKIAQEIDATTAQVLLAYLLHHGISVIPKSTNPQRQKINIDAIDISLTNAQLAEIDSLNENFRLVDGDVFTDDISPYSLGELWT